VKILDFGLAKAVAAAAEGSVEASKSPTLTALATQRGETGPPPLRAPSRRASLSTAAPTSGRSGASGTSLTGVRPSRRDDQHARLDRKDEPDWTTLPDDVPPTAAELIRRCLRRTRAIAWRHRRGASGSRARRPETVGIAAHVSRRPPPIRPWPSPSPDKGSLR
jgi:hypothetical protein